VLNEGAAHRENVGVRGGGAPGDHSGKGGAMEEVVVHCERGTEVGNGLVDEARLVLRLCEIVEGTGMPRLQRGGTLELDDRGGFLTGGTQRGTQSEIDLEAACAECVRPPEALKRIGEPPLPQELGAETEMALGTSTSRFDWHALLVPARHACKLLRVAGGAARTTGRDRCALWVRSTDALRFDGVVIVGSLHVHPSKAGAQKLISGFGLVPQESCSSRKRSRCR
jgi:hypothetical protein